MQPGSVPARGAGQQGRHPVRPRRARTAPAVRAPFFFHVVLLFVFFRDDVAVRRHPFRRVRRPRALLHPSGHHGTSRPPRGRAPGRLCRTHTPHPGRGALCAVWMMTALGLDDPSKPSLAHPSWTRPEPPFDQRKPKKKSPPRRSLTPPFLPPQAQERSVDADLLCFLARSLLHTHPRLCLLVMGTALYVRARPTWPRLGPPPTDTSPPLFPFPFLPHRRRRTKAILGGTGGSTPGR